MKILYRDDESDKYYIVLASDLDTVWLVREDYKWKNRDNLQESIKNFTADYLRKSGIKIVSKLTDEIKKRLKPIIDEYLLFVMFKKKAYESDFAKILEYKKLVDAFILKVAPEDDLKFGIPEKFRNVEDPILNNIFKNFDKAFKDIAINIYALKGLEDVYNIQKEKIEKELEYLKKYEEMIIYEFKD